MHLYIGCKCMLDCLLGMPRNTSVQCSGQWVGTHERTAACKRPMLSPSKHTHTSGPSCSHGCAVRTVHCIKVEHGRETLYYLPGSIPATVNRHDHDHRPCTGQSLPRPRPIDPACVVGLSLTRGSAVSLPLHTTPTLPPPPVFAAKCHDRGIQVGTIDMHVPSLLRSFVCCIACLVGTVE